MHQTSARDWLAYLLALKSHDLEHRVVPHLAVPPAPIENLVLAREEIVRRVLPTDLTCKRNSENKVEAHPARDRSFPTRVTCVHTQYVKQAERSIRRDLLSYQSILSLTFCREVHFLHFTTLKKPYQYSMYFSCSDK